MLRSWHIKEKVLDVCRGILKSQASAEVDDIYTTGSIREAFGSDFTALDPHLSIHAHEGGTTGVQIVDGGAGDEHRAVLTYGRDGCVYLWNCNTGRRVGALYQGYFKKYPERASLSHWQLQIDVTERRMMVITHIGALFSRYFL
jgi:hypothetical protein